MISSSSSGLFYVNTDMQDLLHSTRWQVFYSEYNESCRVTLDRCGVCAAVMKQSPEYASWHLLNYSHYEFSFI